MAAEPSTPLIESLPSYGAAAVRGGAWLGMVQVLRMGLVVVSTVIVARVLTPGDYGVVAMIGPVLALIWLFQEMGLETATIQAPSVSAVQSNALFWINLLISGVLALGLVAVSPAIGWFYHEPRAGHAAAVAAIGLVISSAGLQHSALLTRQLRFDKLGIAQAAGLVATYAVAIVLALWLRTFWALVIGPLAGALAQTTLFWRASPFRPGRPRLRGVSEIARFGGHVTGFNLLNFCVRHLDSVVIARVSGATAVGLYDRSYRLMLLPLENINGPLIRLLEPILAQVRGKPERYRRIFNLAARGTMLAIAPGVVVMALLSDRFTPWLLGDRWAAAGPIFFWLGLNGLMQPIGNLAATLFLTSGRSGALMRWGMVSAVVTLAAFAIGIRGGAVGVAEALFITGLARMPLLFAWSIAGTPVRAADLYLTQIEPLIGACAVGYLFRTWGGGWPFVPMFAAAALLAYAAAMLTSCLSRRGRALTAELVRLAALHARRLDTRRRAVPG